MRGFFDEVPQTIDEASILDGDSRLSAMVRQILPLCTPGLLVTAAAVAVADKIALMNKGSLSQMGSPEELFYDPATSFVAQFLGNSPMNLIPARVIGEDSGFSLLALEDAKGCAHSEAKIKKRLAIGTRIFAGFRPDNIYLEKPTVVSEPQPAWSVAADIVLIEGLGSDYTVHCRTPFGPILFRTDLKLGEGSIIRLLLPAQKAYFFDAERGRRLRNIEFASLACKSAECGT